jgi:dTDP-4-dehydrorhamnose reductase
MSPSPSPLLDPSHPLLVFGCEGQVGKALQVCLTNLKIPVIYMGRADCDLTDQVALNEVLCRHQPQIIINAAAYTAVDKAEAEREQAFAVNTQAPALMARYISQVPHGVLMHYSTDYVFADTKKTPYFETDITGPIDQLSIYGQTKLAGEEAIKEAFNLAHASGSIKGPKALSRYFILRTSWVYGEGKNFIRTILRLAAERDQLKVVADQVGAPTSAEWLAEVGLEMARSTAESGIYHIVPDGEISWHGLATFAVETAASYGEGVEIKSENILPITSQEYPVAAKRPLNSRLSNQKFKKVLTEMAYTTAYPRWQDQVEQYVKDYVATALKS